MCCSGNGSVCLVCLVKQFAICLNVVAILLLNVMEVFSLCGGVPLDRPCMVFQKCACGMFWYAVDISSFKSLRAGSQVFVRFFILCGRVRACSCYASCPLVCCACLPSVSCL